MYTETITQRQALAAGIPPQILNNAAANSDAVDMSKSERASFVLSIGAVSAGGSISAWLQEDTSTAFSNSSNGVAGAFSGSGGTQVSLTALTTSNLVYTFEVRADQLSPGNKFVRLQVKETVGDNVYVAVVAHGDEGKHKPNSANNATAVTTQNVVA